MQCQPFASTFFFNVFFKSNLPCLTVVFAFTFLPGFALFQETVRAMLAAALTTVAAPAVILLCENHQPLLIEIKVAGL